MRPKASSDGGQNDLFKARLDQIVDMGHPLAKLARAIDWGFLEEKLEVVYTDGPGQPPLPTRLMAGLAILKFMHDLSDEVLCARWIENPYYQLFCGEAFFRHDLAFDRSSMTGSERPTSSTAPSRTRSSTRSQASRKLSTTIRWPRTTRRAS